MSYPASDLVSIHFQSWLVPLVSAGSTSSFAAVAIALVPTIAIEASSHPLHVHMALWPVFSTQHTFTFYVFPFADGCSWYVRFTSRIVQFTASICTLNLHARRFRVVVLARFVRDVTRWVGVLWRVPQVYRRVSSCAEIPGRRQSLSVRASSYLDLRILAHFFSPPLSLRASAIMRGTFICWT